MVKRKTHTEFIVLVCGKGEKKLKITRCKKYRQESLSGNEFSVGYKIKESYG